MDTPANSLLAGIVRGFNDKRLAAELAKAPDPSVGKDALQWLIALECENSRRAKARRARTEPATERARDKPSFAPLRA